MKRVLIIGDRGQDGRLLRQLLEGEGCAVTGLSRQATTLPGGCETAPVNITNALAVAALVRDVQPDEIYYLAAFHHSSQQAQGADAQAAWTSSMETNATGPVNFLEAMRLNSQHARFFYAGSCLAYGVPGSTPQTEDTCLRPTCVYGISKAAGAHAVSLFRERHGVFAVTGILFNHESHLRPEYFLSRKIVRTAWRIRKGLEHELVLADLSARADWGYAPDFVEAFRRTLRADTPRDYVIATGELHGVRDWVEKTFALAGLDWHKHVREDASLMVRRREPLVGDITRIREKCAWKPSVGFERMIELLFEHEGNIN